MTDEATNEVADRRIEAAQMLGIVQRLAMKRINRILDQDKGHTYRLADIISIAICESLDDWREIAKPPRRPSDDTLADRLRDDFPL